MEFNAKSEIMKRNRNYKVVDKKIWRVLKCKEIVTLRDFLYKFWFVQFGFWYNVVRRRINVETTSCVYRVMFQFGLVPTISNTTRVTNKARNATRCNNRNDLLHLNFTLKFGNFTLELPQKLGYDKFYVHKKFLRIQNCRCEFIKNLLPETWKTQRKNATAI